MSEPGPSCCFKSDQAVFSKATYSPHNDSFISLVTASSFNLSSSSNHSFMIELRRSSLTR
jgi:hypothetical protein